MQSSVDIGFNMVWCKTCTFLQLNIFDQLRLIVSGIRYKSLFASLVINIGLYQEGLF